jgi:hypothetical protein
MNTRVPGNRYPLHLTISAPFITLTVILDVVGLFLNSGAWLEYGAVPCGSNNSMQWIWRSTWAEWLQCAGKHRR